MRDARTNSKIWSCIPECSMQVRLQGYSAARLTVLKALLRKSSNQTLLTEFMRDHGANIATHRNHVGAPSKIPSLIPILWLVLYALELHAQRAERLCSAELQTPCQLPASDGCDHIANSQASLSAKWDWSEGALRVVTALERDSPEVRSAAGNMRVILRVGVRI